MRLSIRSAICAPLAILCAALATYALSRIVVSTDGTRIAFVAEAP